MILDKLSCSWTPQLSCCSPLFCTHHRWWSLGPPFLRLMNFKHQLLVLGPGTPQSSIFSSWDSFATSRHCRSSRVVPAKVNPRSLASADASRPGYSVRSLEGSFRMAYQLPTACLRPTVSLKISVPSNVTSSPRLRSSPVSTMTHLLPSSTGWAGAWTPAAGAARAPPAPGGKARASPACRASRNSWAISSGPGRFRNRYVLWPVNPTGSWMPSPRRYPAMSSFSKEINSGKTSRSGVKTICHPRPQAQALSMYRSCHSAGGGKS